jgi:hypothetical protein
MYRVTKIDGDQIQTIASCMAHIPRTMQELGTEFVTLQRVDPATHDCMGCLKGW